MTFFSKRNTANKFFVKDGLILRSAATVYNIHTCM